ncbi:MAG: PAS domain S-box protein [Candidatus Bathyarchaeia archaeon]
MARKTNVDEKGQTASSLYARSLIEASLDPFVTISADGKITDVNKATEEVTGCTRDELIGSDFSDYFTEPEKARAGYRKVFTNGYVRDYPLAIRHKSGRITDVLYNATVYRNEAGKIQGAFAAARDVTERQLAEEKLRAASLYSRSLIEASLDPLVTISAEGKITDVNQATENVTGFSREQLIDSDFSDYFTEPDKARMGYKRVFTEGFVRDYPLAIRHRSGKVTHVLYNATVYQNELGQIQGVFAAARDISRRKLAEEKLRAASLYARSLIEASLDPLVTISADGKITDVNKSTEEVTGYSREQLIGSDFSDYFTEPEEARKGYRKVFMEGFVRDYPLAIRHKSGKVIYVLYNATLYKNDAGEIQGVFAAARDVTERRKNEETLRKQAALLDLSPDGIIVKKLDDTITFWSKGAEKLYGWTKEEAIGKKTRRLLRGVSGRRANAIFEEVKRTGKWSGELFHHKKNGGTLLVQTFWLATFDQRGDVAEILESNVDITERKRAEERLRAASLYARSLIEASLDPLVTVSVDGKITDVNKATEDVTGCNREELIGSDFSDYFTEPEKARAGYTQVFTEGFVRDYPLEIRHKSGKITDVLYNASTYRNDRGEVQGAFAAARDITERKAMENEIRQTLEKLKQSNAELEQFAYVASHDLQEPLRMVSSYVQLLERRYKAKLDADADDFIAYAVDGASRMRGLIDDLLTYSRVTRLGRPFESTDLESVLDVVLKNLQASITESGAIVTHDHLPALQGDELQLVQLLQNLIGNAIKFRGKEPPRVHVSAQEQETECLFSVRDNGIGIDPQYFDRLFKIFQRLHTREEYPGSGIGLAICKKIVERHGGRIWIESQPGKGSTMYFTLSRKHEGGAKPT